ncbi:hypothetical protein D3C80_2001770 [compost metagenome]
MPANYLCIKAKWAPYSTLELLEQNAHRRATRSNARIWASTWVGPVCGRIKLQPGEAFKAVDALDFSVPAAQST